MTLQASPVATPRCAHFGRCGGCQAQHISYEQQLENKRNRLAYLLGKQYAGEIAVHASEPYGYRNRIDFLVTVQGLAMRGERGGTFPLEDCPIADERITAALREVNAWLRSTPSIIPFNPQRQSGVMKYCTIRVARERTVIFMLNEEATEYGAHVAAIKEFAQGATIENVLIATSAASEDDSLSVDAFAVKGSVYLVEDFLGVPMTYHAAGFFQNNPRVAQAMVAYVRDALATQSISDRTVVDAYGGVGTFAFALAPLCKAVVSVESYPLAAECLARTKEATGIKNITAHTLDAAKMEKLHLPADAVYLVDPPRSGMDMRVLRYLLQTRPETIAYVSCNPSQLAKELLALSKTYAVERAALFDMFPQTNHIEAVVLLKRKIVT